MTEKSSTAQGGEIGTCTESADDFWSNTPSSAILLNSLFESFSEHQVHVHDVQVQIEDNQNWLPEPTVVTPTTEESAVVPMLQAAVTTPSFFFRLSLLARTWLTCTSNTVTSSPNSENRSCSCNRDWTCQSRSCGSSYRSGVACNCRS